MALLAIIAKNSWNKQMKPVKNDWNRRVAKKTTWALKETNNTKSITFINIQICDN